MWSMLLKRRTHGITLFNGTVPVAVTSVSRSRCRNRGRFQSLSLIGRP